MKAFVITLIGNKPSEDAAANCIESAKEHGWDAEVFEATAPKHDPKKLFENDGIEITGRLVNRPKDNRLSGGGAELGCWRSHWNLWNKCVELDEPICILEHDAFILEPCPKILEEGKFNCIVNIGRPHYGRFRTPKSTGLIPMTSRDGLPGTHAYIINPEIKNVIRFIKDAGHIDSAIDTYMHKKRWPDMQEWYPHLAYSAATFSCIQGWQKDMTNGKGNPADLSHRTVNALIDADTGEKIPQKQYVDEKGNLITHRNDLK